MINVVANLTTATMVSITDISATNFENATYRKIEQIKFGQDYRYQPHRLIIEKSDCLHFFDLRKFNDLYNNFIFEGILDEPLMMLQSYGHTPLPRREPLRGAIPEINDCNVAISKSGKIYIATFSVESEEIELYKIAEKEGLFKHYEVENFNNKEPFNIAAKKGERGSYILELKVNGVIEEIEFKVNED